MSRSDEFCDCSVRRSEVRVYRTVLYNTSLSEAR